MNRKTTRFRTLRESSAHKHGPAAMKPGLFYPYRRHLLAALALPAAALLLASCEAPASPVTAASSSPSPAVPSAPPPAPLEVPTISGLPNMAQIKQRLNDQYAESAKSTDGKVKFTLSKTPGTTVRAVITYADDHLRKMEIGDNKYDIKTITITREVDGKTIPTRVEYKDKDDTTRKTITSRYFQRDDPANNVQQSLEGGAQLSEAAAEGHTLNIRGEEKDAADKILRTFEATEEIRGGKIILRTTYSPDKEGFTEIVTTENGIPTRKEVIYPDKEAAAKDIKTETITYENPPSAIFYPDPDGKEIKRDTVKNDGSILTTMRDKSTITTTTTAKGGTLAVHKNPDGTETQRVETKWDRWGNESTITTTTTAKGGTLAVHKSPDGTEAQRVETKSDKSTITTTKWWGDTLAVHKNRYGTETQRVETKSDKSTITTTTTPEGGTLAVYKNPAGNEIQRVETKSDKSTITTTITPEGGTLVVNRDTEGRETSRVETRKDKSTITTTYPEEGGKLVVNKDTEGRETSRLETKSDGSTIETTPTAKGGTLAVYKNPDGTETQRVETKSDKSTITTTTTAGGGTLAVYKNPDGTETQRVETRTDKSTITTKPSAAGGTKELVIHPSVTVIEDKAFQNNNLTSVTIGNGVKTIGKDAFADNRTLKTVTITGTGAIKNNAFTYEDSSLLTKGIFGESGSSGIELVVEDGITSIGDEAFSKNDLTSVTIGNSVRTIGFAAFSENKLNALTIPPSVTSIGHAAFVLNKLTSVILPKVLYDTRGKAFNWNPPGLKFYEYSASAPGSRGPELGTN